VSAFVIFLRINITVYISAVVVYYYSNWHLWQPDFLPSLSHMSFS